MTFFAPSKLLLLAVAAGGALGAFNPPRYAMTSWDTPAASAGVRLYGSTPDRNGILELSLDNGRLNASSTPPYPWHADVHLLGTVSTANGSDFAAISTQGGTKVVVFFIRSNGALSYIQSPSTPTAAWSLGLVSGSPKPAPGTSLGAAMWGPNHMSVFYQDAEGIIFESEYTNGTWATPVGFADGNIGTDIHAVATGSGSGLAKFLYFQGVRRIQEWRSPSSNSNPEWSQVQTMEQLPGQSSNANSRFAIAFLADDAIPGRILYKPDAGNMGLVGGIAGGVWRFFNNFPVNSTATTDVATTLQFAGDERLNWWFFVFTGPDGTLQQLPYRAAAGYDNPSQIVAAPNKVKGIV